MKIASRLDNLDQIPCVVEDLGRAEAWSPELTFRVNFALEELGLNIIQHSGVDDLSEIELTVTSAPDAVTIEITDDGQPFNPLEDAPVPDVSAPLEDRPVGGLGVFLVRSMMDDLRYQRELGRNHLTLVSRRVG